MEVSMLEGLFVGKGEQPVSLLPAMGNRHGLIAGATGTGKTVSLQVLAEQFSRIGVPVFMADIKGDLSGVSQTGQENPKIKERLAQLGISGFTFSASPVTFWDVFGQKGHPVRTTPSEMGPLLFSRLLQLNEIQEAVLTVIFRLADDNGWLLLDMKDLQALVKFASENAQGLVAQYGNLSRASVGTIQRALLSFEERGGSHLFGEPALNLMDLIQTDGQGRGMINILMADQLMQSPQVYATFLLWLLSELFEKLPEVGDLDKPKMVFFFDEAHLLFDEAPKVLLDKIEQVVRLVRSKGVGVYFVTQNPLDIPDNVLGQLGNRIQHALRAFTPRDQKAVKAAAETFRTNPKVNVTQVITELGLGEALVSFLDEKGIPTPVERALIAPPHGRIGPITPEERQQILQASILAGFYEKAIDRISACEMLSRRAEQVAQMETAPAQQPSGFWPTSPAPAPRGRPQKSFLETVTEGASRAAASSLGRQIVRGVLGSLFGGRRW
jgi:DNA double-strand break repair helicase HerA and related ATPase